MVKVWIFIALMGAGNTKSGFVIDNLATLADCQRIEAQYKETQYIRMQCVEVWKAKQ